MKLFIIGPEEIYQWTESSVRGALQLNHTVLDGRYSTYQTTRIWCALQRIHSPKVLIDAARVLEKRHRHQRHLNLVKLAEKFKPDLTLILKGETLSGPTLDKIKKNSGQLVGWWVDDPTRIPEAHQCLGIFDHIFVFDRSVLNKLKSQGLSSVFYLPCACDPELFYPKKMDAIRPELDCEVAFVASWYPEREELIRNIQNCKLGLRGPGWGSSKIIHSLPPGSYRGRKLSPTDCCHLYRWAKISPNIHHSQSKNGGLNTRTFEIIAAGGFELVDRVEGIECMFDIGKDLIVYESVLDFGEKMSYYLKNDRERERIISNGRTQVMNNHTYSHRISTLIKESKIIR